MRAVLGELVTLCSHGQRWTVICGPGAMAMLPWEGGRRAEGGRWRMLADVVTSGDASATVPMATGDGSHWIVNQ